MSWLWWVGCRAPGEPASAPDWAFARVGTGDTGLGGTADTGAADTPPPLCRVVREEENYGFIDYVYTDFPTYTLRTLKDDSGIVVITTEDLAGLTISSWQEWIFAPRYGYFYDAAGRLLEELTFEAASASGNFAETYTYDLHGREVSRLRVPNQRAGLDADGLHEERTEYDAGGRPLLWTYDQWVDGAIEWLVTYTYDADGLLVEEFEDLDPQTPSDWSTSTTRWEYDERGLPTRSELDGISWYGAPYCDYREYTYDDRGDLVIEDNVSCVDGRAFLRWTDTYDDAHRRIESVWNLIDLAHPGPDDDHWWWTYDEHGNLTSEVRQQPGLSRKTTTWTWECR